MELVPFCINIDRSILRHGSRSFWFSFSIPISRFLKSLSIALSFSTFPISILFVLLYTIKFIPPLRGRVTTVRCLPIVSLTCSNSLIPYDSSIFFLMDVLLHQISFLRISNSSHSHTSNEQSVLFFGGSNNSLGLCFSFLCVFIALDKFIISFFCFGFWILVYIVL